MPAPEPNTPISMAQAGALQYPVPDAPPVYPKPPKKTTDRKHFSLYELLDAVCIVIAIALTFWFAWLLLREGFSLNLAKMLYLVAFFVVVTYLALPRMHQVFTLIYVPDYFISRTRTADGVLGDPVNLAVDGQADDIHAAMQRAGWVRADPITLRSSWGIIVSSLTGRSYPEAPVSSLFLFGNQQAFAYQKEVGGSASERHHVRFWPVPSGWLLPGGFEVGWLAAGTYDKGVGFSLFTGQVTHKIDANIDLERDYIINSVRFADPDTNVSVIEDFSTAYHSRNGGGDEVRTDGNLPVLDVSGAYDRAPAHVQLPLSEREKPPRERELPPAQLIIGGIVTAFTILVPLLLALLLAIAPESTSGDAELELARDNVAVYLTYAGIAVVALVLMFRRHRWARLVLMMSAIALATSDMVDVSRLSAANTSLMSLLDVSLTLVMVLTLSSDEARRWVANGRRDPEVVLGPSSGLPQGGAV